MISICNVPVKIKGRNGNNVIRTYAHLYSCIQETFILDQLRNHRFTAGRETSVTIKTINGKFRSLSKANDGLQVSGFNGDKNLSVPLSTTFTKNEFLVDDDDITKFGQLKQWKYLEAVATQLNFAKSAKSVGLLLEQTVPRN